MRKQRKEPLVRVGDLYAIKSRKKSIIPDNPLRYGSVVKVLSYISHSGNTLCRVQCPSTILNSPNAPNNALNTRWIRLADLYDPKANTYAEGL